MADLEHLTILKQGIEVHSLHERPEKYPRVLPALPLCIRGRMYADICFGE